MNGRRRRRMAPAEAGRREPDMVTALARGLELLRAFGPGEDYLGNAELARRTALPRPTVSRLTNTLTRLGYLQYSPELEKYRLGPGVLALGYRYLAGVGVRHLARPLMQALADSADCTVSLGTADGVEMTYLEVCASSGPWILRMDVGARVPIATTAMGRAYAAALSDTEREALLERLSVHHGERWETLAPAMARGLEEYRRNGFCIVIGEWEPTVSAVAVPLSLRGGSEMLVLSCGGPALRLTQPVLEQELGPRLRELATSLKALMEGQGREVVRN